MNDEIADEVMMVILMNDVLLLLCLPYFSHVVIQKDAAQNTREEKALVYLTNIMYGHPFRPVKKLASYFMQMRFEVSEIKFLTGHFTFLHSYSGGFSTTCSD